MRELTAAGNSPGCRGLSAARNHASVGKSIMRQVTAATVILALLATSAPPALAQDSAQGLRDAIDADTAERISADAAATASRRS